MNYSLLKFTFPDFDKKEPAPLPNVENFTENTPNYSPAEYLPMYNHNVELMEDAPVSQHNMCIEHALSCITCRDAMMKRMSFSDRNRDIIDALPYILILIILIVVYKMI